MSSENKAKKTMEPGSSRSSTTVQLQVQQRDGAWNDAGSVHLLDEGNDSSNNNDSSAGSSSLRNQLPKHAKAFLRRRQQQQQQQSESTTIPRRQIYLYRHAASNNNAPNTNLCLFLHGAGDTHTKFDALAQQMALPQTACLSIQAVHHIQLPFDLGTTWFQEMDFATGDTLPIQHPNRIQSLQKAVQWLTRLLHYCCNNCGDNGGWPAERIFLLGYGAGACLAMETCAAAAASDTTSATIYGGAVCVGGGIRVASDHDSKRSSSSNNNTVNKTPILLMVGERDGYFTPQNAQEAAHAYGNENVQIHLERNKGQGMIQNADEMRVVMQFFADRLVRQSTMGGTASTASH